MSKKLIIGVIGRNSIGPWIIPRKIQTLICHNTNLKKNEKFIKKIIFISIFQLGKKEKEIFDNLKKIKLYNSYFYLEDLNNENLNLRLLKNYIKEFLNMKYYPVKKFNFNKNNKKKPQLLKLGF